MKLARYSRISKKVDGLFDGAATPVKTFDNYIYLEHSIVGIQDIRNEALRLSLLSDTLPIDAGKARTLAHADFEKQMTRLGLSIAEEANRRAKVRLGYVLSLSGEILRLQRKHQDSIVRDYRKIAVRKNFLESAIETITEESQTNPLNPTEGKKYREYFKELKALKAKHRILVLREKEIIFRQEMLYRLLDAEKHKLVKAYRSLIAEIRPVGGSFSMTKFSDEEMVKVMNNTVGRYYPSDWINASNNFSPLVIKMDEPASDADSVSYYAANRIFCTEDSPWAAISDTVILGDPDTVAMLYAVMRHSIPELSLNSTVFFCENDHHQAMVVPNLDFFNPDVHESNEDGSPSGEGWVLNDFPWDKYQDEEGEYPFEDTFPLNQWFKRTTYQGENFDTIVVDDFKEDHAYHEFAHRAEHVVKNGLIIFQEQAFLDRRTKEKDGTRASLIMYNGSGGIGSPRFNRDASFDHLSPSPSDEVETSEEYNDADDVFQRSVMEQGNFITPYIGRIYASSGNREVLSMGAEMIFAGTYGAGYGYDPDYDKPDFDYRGFVLGAFAVL